MVSLSGSLFEKLQSASAALVLEDEGIRSPVCYKIRTTPQSHCLKKLRRSINNSWESVNTTTFEYFATPRSFSEITGLSSSLFVQTVPINNILTYLVSTKSTTNFLSGNTHYASSKHFHDEVRTHPYVLLNIDHPTFIPYARDGNLRIDPFVIDGWHTICLESAAINADSYTLAQNVMRGIANDSFTYLATVEDPKRLSFYVAMQPVDETMQELPQLVTLYQRTQMYLKTRKSSLLDE